MTSYVTPKKNAAFVFYVSLEDRANAGLFKASPTLAAGDVLVATDDAAPANITTLPAVDADFTKRLKVSLSAAEMNGDNVTVIFSDAAGAEWYDLEVNIQTSARQIDDLAYPATSGRSLTVEATGAASALLYPTQEAVEFGQIKITANVAGEGALHVVNSNAVSGTGIRSSGAVGVENIGRLGQGQYNQGMTQGVFNYAIAGVPVEGVDAAGIRTAIGMADANLDTQLAGLATASDVADGFDELEAALLSGLSGTTVTVVSSVVGGTITVYVADTWRFTVASDQLDLAGYETLGLVVKRSARQADTQALLYLRTDTGLVRMDGAAPASAGNGVLTKGASSFTAVVHVAETQGLVPGSYTWWLKGIDTTPAPDEAVTLATGEFVVVAAGLQAVV